MNPLVLIDLATAIVWFVGLVGAVFAYRAFKQGADLVAGLAFLLLAVERGWQAWSTYSTVVTMQGATTPMLPAALVLAGALLVVAASRMGRVAVI